MATNEKKLQKKYKQLSQETRPKPNIIKDCLSAFVVGGLICDVGQFIMNILKINGVHQDDVGAWVSIIMIFLGALLTGIGVYDKIASIGGAGTVVPITGFSNAIVSPAIEFKKEGFIFGVAAKMFTIAGPVLVYGIGSSIVIGIIYYLIKIMG